MVPYTLQADTGAVTVDFQLDGGVEIAPFVILSGQTGSGLDVLNDASVQQTIAELEDRGFTYEKPVKLSPDLSQTTADSTVTYNSDAQNITLLFSPLQKIYLVDEAGRLVRSWSRNPAEPGVLGRRLFQQLRGTNTIESWVPQPWQINS